MKLLTYYSIHSWFVNLSTVGGFFSWWAINLTFLGFCKSIAGSISRMYLTFPSFSVGWNVAREDFWKPLEQWVNMFKFKASWGELGNQNTSSLYPFYQTMPLSIGTGQWLLDGALSTTANIPALISTELTWRN